MERIYNCSFKINEKIKKEFDTLCERYGLTASATLNVFIRNCIAANALLIDTKGEIEKDIAIKMKQAQELRDANKYKYADEEIEKMFAEDKKERNIQ
ncbi:MAG: type II toxin-antitoxin system RelB/DinJ family antitoxin [Mycoplasmataceae bacterium]|jgi:addiction module RelB/DinJ family antitoxin|nr:type II toxin-antitoxin system RelB/DinJ family antitoxin [Mycoplasmataceae bacterium]